MKDLNHNFDKHIKSALENYQVPYQPDDWQLMETMIDDAEKPTRPALIVYPGRRVVKLLLATAVVLFLAGAGINYQWQNHTSLQLPLTNANSNTTEYSASAEYQKGALMGNDKETDITNTTSAASGAGTNSGFTQLQPDTPVDAQFLNLIEKSTGDALNNEVQNSDESREWVSKASRGNNNHLPLLPNKTATPAEETKMGTENTGNTTDEIDNFDNNNQSLTPVINHLQNEPIAAAALQEAESLAAIQNATTALLPPFMVPIRAGLISVSLEALMAKEKELQQVLTRLETAPSISPAPQLPPRLPRFSLGIYSSADANSLWGNDVMAGMSSGIQFSYRFAKHWQIAGGAAYSYKKLNTTYNNRFASAESALILTDIEYYPVTDKNRRTILEMELLEIPVSIQYNPMPNKRFSPFVNVGYSVYVPFNNRVTYNKAVNGLYAYTGISQQSLLANAPFTPNPRPNSGSPDNDPLVSNPNIFDIENTDIEIESVFNNSSANTYWANSLPDYQTGLTANAMVQISQAPGINRPLTDIIHLSIGANYRLTKRLHLMAATQLKGSLLRHSFEQQLPVHIQKPGGQRLITASVQVGVVYSFE